MGGPLRCCSMPLGWGWGVIFVLYLLDRNVKKNRVSTFCFTPLGGICDHVESVVSFTQQLMTEVKTVLTRGFQRGSGQRITATTLSSSSTKLATVA